MALRASPYFGLDDFRVHETPPGEIREWLGEPSLPCDEDVLRSVVSGPQIETFLRHLFAGPTGVVIVVAALLFAAVSFARLGRPDLPYVAAPALLTAAERNFFFVLRQAVAADYQLFAKVRLGDIIQVQKGVSGKRRFAALGRITSKHADFVLCDPRSFATTLVIELDDRSHALPARQQRDQFFDAALKVAAVPVLRVPVRRAYSPDEIRRLVYETLSERSARHA